MKKRLFTVFCTAALLLLAFGITDTKAALKDSEWDTTKRESVYISKKDITYRVYYSKNGKEAWINSIRGYYNTLSIPKTIKGRKVTRIGDIPIYFSFSEYPYKVNNILEASVEPVLDDYGDILDVKKIIIPDTVEVIMPYTFSGMINVKTIRLPKKLSMIQKHTFLGCKNLKTLVIPEGLKKIDSTALEGCSSLKSLKLSAKNKTYQVRNNCLIRKKDKALVLAASAGKELEIPNGVKAIKENALSNIASETVFIPSTVNKMEEDALTNQRIKNVVVSADNNTLAKDGQCIYNRKDKSLVVAIADEHGELKISDEVEKMTTEYSVVNYGINWMDKEYFEKVIFPANLKKVIGAGLNKVLNADALYFTGAVPPVMKHYKKLNYMDKINYQMHRQKIYVPEDYNDVYKKWFQRYNRKGNYKIYWNTYDPTEVFGTAGKQ